MLRGRDMLCFSHDWNGDPLSKTHLMRLLAKENRVLWVNSIGYRAPTMSGADMRRALNKLSAMRRPLEEVEPNLFVLSPLAIPLHHRASVQFMNRHLLQYQVKRAMRQLGFRRPMNWVFNPAASILAGTLGEDRVMYYCVDEYTAFSGVAADSMAKLEARLLRRADVVFVSSERLHRSKGRSAKRCFLVRHGVDYEHFRQALCTTTVVPDEVAHLPRPIIGYFGLMSSDWVDVDLLAAVAERYSEGSVVLLGKVAMDLKPLARLSNVHVLGRKPYSTLPGYCKAFDVGLIPFPISEVTLNSNPLKAREYLAAGLPVVSTCIPEVEVLGQCGIGATPEQFADRVAEALSEPGPAEWRSETMREH